MKARRKSKKIHQNTDFMRISQKLTSYKKAERRAGKESCEGLNTRGKVKNSLAVKKESCEGLNTRGKVRNSLAAKRTPNEGRQGEL